MTVNAANVQRVRLLQTKRILCGPGMPQGESINAEYMIKYLKDTGNRFQNLKKDKISLKEMHFRMDNARPHNAAATQHFLASRNVNFVKQSPYSPVPASPFGPRGKIIAAQLT